MMAEEWDTPSKTNQHIVWDYRREIKVGITLYAKLGVFFFLLPRTILLYASLLECSLLYLRRKTKVTART